MNSVDYIRRIYGEMCVSLLACKWFTSSFDSTRILFYLDGMVKESDISLKKAGRTWNGFWTRFFKDDPPYPSGYGFKAMCLDPRNVIRMIDKKMILDYAVEEGVVVKRI